MKIISILGSTGSIGTQTLDIVRANPDLKVSALAAGRNIDLLEKQVREFKPSLVSVTDEADASTLRVKLADMNVRIVSGMDGLIEVAGEPESSVLVTGIVICVISTFFVVNKLVSLRKDDLYY